LFWVYSQSQPNKKAKQTFQPSSVKPFFPTSADTLIPPALCAVHPSLLVGNIPGGSYEQRLRLGDVPLNRTPSPDIPYSESRVAQEHNDAKDFFLQRPHLLLPALNILRKYDFQHMPCEVTDTVNYQRDVVNHFVRNPNTNFDDSDPFYVVDLGRVIVQMAKFKKHLPSVEPFYAVKCNPSLALLSMISALGGKFDCASSPEFLQVIDGKFATCDSIIFANPCKSVSDLKKAELSGVRYVTFDNPDELLKIATHMPSAKAVVRIKTNDSAAVCAFSTKFGASMTDVPLLLRRAHELRVQVVGCSFHVGSGNNDPQAYIGSILNARKVFDEGLALGFEMKLLDLGGGLPGTDPPFDSEGKPTCLSFVEIASHIRPLLARHFSNARVIAEPGRYFTASSHTLALNVHSHRRVPMPNGEMEYQYYVNDGLYHSFNCIVYDHAHPELHLVSPDSEARQHTTTIFGPTCDSLDCILKRQPFPELSIGEWLFVPNMGSYTTAAGAPFNGFATRRTEYICSLPFALAPPSSGGDDSTEN
jgi:ornithine decarboxylase